MASLCGLAQFVTTQLSTDLAVWFCVNSCYLNLPANRDTFRFHVYNMEPLIDIVKVFGYPIHKGVNDHLSRTKSLLNTLAGFKKLKNYQKVSFKEALRSLYQNSITINPKNIGKDFLQIETSIHFVPIDGQATKQQIEKIIALLPKSMQKLSIEEIVTIGGLIDAQKLASDIFLDYNFKANELPKGSVNWKYGLKQLKQFNDEHLKICPKTLRLYYDKNWESAAENVYKVASTDLFKGRKYFIGFLSKYKRMPTKEQLILFYYNRYVVTNKIGTLPYLTEEWSERILSGYTKVMEQNKITVDQALKLLQASMSFQKRQ